MKKATNYIKLSLLILFTLISGLLYGQGPSVENMLPASVEGKVRWMEKHGFPAREYQWTEPTINEHLKQALAYRPAAVGYTVGGSVLAGSGVVLGTVGMMGLIAGSVVNSVNVLGEDEDLGRYGVMMGVGAGATAGGLVMVVLGAKRRRWARQELRRANELYQSNYIDKDRRRN